MSDPDSQVPEIEVRDVPGPDFTVYKEKEGFKLLTDGLETDERGDGREKEYSYSGSLHVKCGEESVDSRALACPAYGGKFWSITIRCNKDNVRPKPPLSYQDWIRQKLNEYVVKKLDSDLKPGDRDKYNKAKLKDFLGYYPGGCPAYSETADGAQPQKNPASGQVEPGPAADHREKLIFLNEIYTLCDEINKVLFTSERPSGLIAITGATDSSKSLITRGLIFLFLQKAAEQARETKQRKPHLITYEDPVEKYYVMDPVTNMPRTLDDLEALLDAFCIDYTPREKSSKGEALKNVTKDALRQTPAVLFAGETREKDDWIELLQFAGSGHLVITTSHASSVVEAMSGIFRDTETKTPSQRSEMARRILGIINIRSINISQPAPPHTNIRTLIPALWKRTSHSMNNLIADGLTSLLPARDREREIGYYGRTYFAERLTDELGMEPRMTKEMRASAFKADALKEIKKKAKEWDIKGV